MLQKVFQTPTITLILILLFILTVLYPLQAIASNGTHTLTGPVSLLWEKRYNLITESPSGIAVDGAGNVYVTGSTSNYPQAADYITIKYDPQGNIKWVTTYNGPFNKGDSPVDIELDAEGDVYVTGLSWSGYGSEGGTYTDIATVKYDAETGQEIWVSRYITPGQDAASAIAIDSQGNVYVTGETPGPPYSFPDYITIKYDTNGNQIWTARYDGPDDVADHPSDIAVGPDGGIYVTGTSHLEYESVLPCGDFREGFATVKYSPEGIEQWVIRYDGPEGSSSVNRARALSIDNQGNIYVVGMARETCTSAPPNYATIKYHALGSELWVRQHAGNTPDVDGARDIDTDVDGFIYVTGSSVTLKYSPQGEEIWTMPTFVGGGGYVIKADNRGGAYVAGTSFEASGITRADFLTAKFDSGGTKVWEARYDSGYNSNEFTQDMTIDHSGKIYVTGSSETPSTGSDIVTLKYSDSAPTILEYTGNEFLARHGSQVTLKSHLTDTNNQPIPGKPIDFLITDGINSLEAQELTNDNGDAIALVNVNLPIGLYTLTSAFTGDDDYTETSSPPLEFTVYEPVPGMSTNGGGVIGSGHGGVQSFGFSVRYVQGQETPRGNLSFRDIQGGIQITSDVIEYLVVSGNTARFGGTCTVDGEPCTFTVNVTAGGAGVGSFSIGLSTGYSTSGILTGGNIITKEN